MKVKVTIESRSSDARAEAIYSGDSIVVQPGGKISSDFAEHIRGGNLAKSFRCNPDYVNEERVIIKPCKFSSPSTAAQFVTGRSTNGYEAWKVERKLSLGQYLKNKGYRD